MERPEVVDPLKEEEQQPIFRQPPVEEQTDDAFSVREQAERAKLYNLLLLALR